MLSCPGASPSDNVCTSVPHARDTRTRLAKRQHRERVVYIPPVHDRESPFSKDQTRISISRKPHQLEPAHLLRGGIFRHRTPCRPQAVNVRVIATCPWRSRFGHTVTLTRWRLSPHRSIPALENLDAGASQPASQRQVQSRLRALSWRPSP